MTVTALARLWTASFTAAKGRGYSIVFPEIPGLATKAETVSTVKAAAEACLRRYLSSPSDDTAVLATVIAAAQRESCRDE